jgi:NTE family protein
MALPRVGLVLGGGGVVGQAYHAGVLAALENDFGFDPRTVDVIVGTSAGSITGALLRLGVSADDLAAWTVKAPLAGDAAVLHQLATTPVPDLAPFHPLHLLRQPMRLPGWDLIRRAITQPLQFRPLAAALTLLAPGRHDILGQLGALEAVAGAEWPQRDLWICAVRRRDGRRVVFGRPGAPRPRLPLAVGASCAVPGYFTPVRIGRHDYLDGGIHSPTNAATLRNRALDLVIIVSPMSGPAGSHPGLPAAARRHSAMLLAREVRALRMAGTRTLVFAPGAEEQRVLGDDMMSADHLDEIIQRSYLAAGAHAAAAGVHTLLRPACHSTSLRRQQSAGGGERRA